MLRRTGEHEVAPDPSRSGFESLQHLLLPARSKKGSCCWVQVNRPPPSFLIRWIELRGLIRNGFALELIANGAAEPRLDTSPGLAVETLPIKPSGQNDISTVPLWNADLIRLASGPT